METESATGIDRVFLVLQFIGASDPPPTHTEISTSLNIVKSTLSAILAMLRAKGYVEQIGRRYVPGPTLLAFCYKTASRATGDIVLREALRPIIEALSRDTGETVCLSVEIGGDHGRPGFVLAIDTVESANSLRFVPGLGEPLTLLDTAAGQVLLAFSGRSPAALAERGRLSDRGLLPGAMEQELAAVRARGFAVTVRPNRDGVVSVAAPVLDCNGIPVAAISVFGPVHRIAPDGSSVAPALKHWVGQALARLPHA